MKTRKKALGFWMLTALVAGNMIASGVFLLPAALAQFGSIGIVAWIMTALGAICLALVFADLARIFPKIGGPYAYCEEAFGDFVGFQVAYNYWIAIWIGNAAIIVAFVSYLSFFWPALTYNHPLAFMVGSAALWILTAINSTGIKQAGLVQLVTTILKMIPLFVIATVGLFFIHPNYLSHFNISHSSNMHAFTAAITLTLWSFIGLESATVPADDVENPKKNIPRATMTGTLIAALIYILCTLAIMGIMPMKTLAFSSSPFADAANLILGTWGGWLIGFGAVTATLGSMNGWILMQGQVPLAAARDKLFPKSFAKISTRGVPTFGLIVSSVLINILLAMNFTASLVKQFTLIILLATFASLLPYFYTCLARIIFALNRKKEVSRTQLIQSIVIAILAFIYVIWAFIGSGPKIIFYGMLLLLSSVPVYVWMKQQHNKN